MTNIATLLETAIAQALPDNWQQEPETHLPALSLIISLSSEARVISRKRGGSGHAD